MKSEEQNNAKEVHKCKKKSFNCSLAEAHFDFKTIFLGGLETFSMTHLDFLTLLSRSTPSLLDGEYCAQLFPGHPTDLDSAGLGYFSYHPTPHHHPLIPTLTPAETCEKYGRLLSHVLQNQSLAETPAAPLILL